MNPYQNLPAPPAKCSASTILARFLDAIGYRFHLATLGLSEKEMAFRPVEGSMNMIELLDHIYILVFFAHHSFDASVQPLKGLKTFEEYRNAILRQTADFRETVLPLSEAEIEETTVYLKRTGTTYPFWNLINGPIADTLTHIGQINSWRRMAGNPVPGISPFTGEPF